MKNKKQKKILTTQEYQNSVVLEVKQDHLNFFSPLNLQAVRDLLHNFYESHIASKKCTNKHANAGRPKYDVCAMMKICIYQEQRRLSDVAMAKELVINKELQESIFDTENPVTPRKATICRYRCLFSKFNLINKIFQISNENNLKQLKQHLENTNHQLAQQMEQYVLVDSTIEKHSVTRNLTKEQLDQIHKNNKNKSDFLTNKRQKELTETDASWTFKYNVWSFGYKEHVATDSTTGLILNYSVTTASVHDVNELVPLVYSLKEKPKCVFADAGYIGNKYKTELEKEGITLITPYKKQKKQEFTEQQKTCNYSRARIRANVEHVFAKHKENRELRTIGLERANFAIGLRLLIQNIKRTKAILAGKVSIKLLSQKILPKPI